ncbi:hypothetical protein [Salininema proteolyticum]|uniref:Uncharacterized protein n=1 Tax=Salininema proteolyticum TaxID=1607685 RepID=A0ABV8U046_9ACTN
MTCHLSTSSVISRGVPAVSDDMIPVSEAVFAMDKDMIEAALYMALSDLPPAQWPTVGRRDHATWVHTLNLVIKSIKSQGMKRIDERCSWLVDGSYQETINMTFDDACFDRAEWGWEALFGNLYFNEILRFGRPPIAAGVEARP